MTEESSRPSWLLAAWPGMGNVAILAAGHLIQQLGCQLSSELDRPEHFDVLAVDVREGVVSTPRLPRSMFFRPVDPVGEIDLTVFVGEAQPSQGSYTFAQSLLNHAQRWGVDRVVTFASMASQLHPTDQPRVFGAATRAEMIDEMRGHEVAPLEGGQIGGMNGVLIGAAAGRGLSGLCLMGEIPFFAAGVANPKAAHAVVAAFAHLAGFEVDLTELEKQGERVDRTLVELLERMREQAEEQAGGSESQSPQWRESLEQAESQTPEQPALTEEARSRIERLFTNAAKDRSQAFVLKQELDRLGVFAEYEDRFLDLFKRAE